VALKDGGVGDVVQSCARAAGEQTPNKSRKATISCTQGKETRSFALRRRNLNANDLVKELARTKALFCTTPSPSVAFSAKLPCITSLK
jgi:hypothetical protein